MNKYTELKDKHSKMVNDFPMAFAFSDKQFEEAKKKLGIESNNDLLSIASGGFIRKTDSAALAKATLERNKETEEAMKDDEYLYQGFLYELGNHEFCITGDPESTLDCFGLTIDAVKADERLTTIFAKAKRKYWESDPQY